MDLLNRNEKRLLAPMPSGPYARAEARERSARAAFNAAAIGLGILIALALAVVLLLSSADSLEETDNFVAGCLLYTVTPLALLLPLVAIVSGAFGLTSSRRALAVVGIVVGALQILGIGAGVWWLFYGSALP